MKFTQLLSCCDRYLCFDGGMGTMLQARGLQPGMSPEIFSLQRPDILKSIHMEYIAAGADIITTNTFGGSRIKLPQELEPVSFNRTMAEIARAAAKESNRQIFVAGSVGPTGQFIHPLGKLSFREMVEIYKEQIRGLAAGDVDLILAETHFDLAEIRAVVVALREECDLPIGVSMTFEKGVSLTGTTPEVFKETMINMGVNLIATNCNAGPAEMGDVVNTLLKNCPLPVLVEPNAGLPELKNGKTVFRLGAEKFAELTVDFARSGARLLGGCCGTTPQHIASLRKRLDDLPKPLPLPKSRQEIVLTSRSELVRVGLNQPIKIIGERINPTGKKQLTGELQAGKFNLAMRYAEEQITAGARILDVNVGAPMVDEIKLLPNLVERLSGQFSCPLCIDSSNPDALEHTLEVYPGSALINSINGESGRIARLAPLCLKYGSPFILLPLTGGDLPDTSSKRIAILEKMLLELEKYGVPKNLVLVDVLALTISSNTNAGKACLETIYYCSQQGLNTSIGLSNISFGMPAREILNANFLSMCAGAGLCACIANPMNISITNSLAASNALLGFKEEIDSFATSYTGWKAGNSGSGTTTGGPVSHHTNMKQDGPLTLAQAVIKGLKEEIVALVEEALQQGEDPFELVQTKLIPAINVVGEKYEHKELFLPQLLKAAETMQTAFTHLKPLLEKNKQDTIRPVVIMATVEGDIHDIGKNIVILMLNNHGFEVIDLGKDVPAAQIVDAAEKNNADLIGLSALMTTTMVRMEETIKLAKERKIPARIMVGGAVVTQDFADSIGADGYAQNAVECVRIAKKLLN